MKPLRLSLCAALAVFAITAAAQQATVEQAAALAQVDEVLGVEREVKRAHITLLIQIKNTLSAEQQAKLAAARATAARPDLRVY